MKNYDSWEKFAKTGNIMDYLSYIACTVEDSTHKGSEDSKEGGYLSDNDTGIGDGFVSHANW